MVEGLTYIEDSLSRVARCSSSLFSSLRRTSIAAFHRGVEQWQLVGLITRRSGVRIPSPLPNTKGLPPGGPFLLLPAMDAGRSRGPSGEGSGS